MPSLSAFMNYEKNSRKERLITWSRASLFSELKVMNMVQTLTARLQSQRCQDVRSAKDVQHKDGHSNPLTYNRNTCFCVCSASRAADSLQQQEDADAPSDSSTLDPCSETLTQHLTSNSCGTKFPGTFTLL